MEMKLKSKRLFLHCRNIQWKGVEIYMEITMEKGWILLRDNTTYMTKKMMKKINKINKISIKCKIMIAIPMMRVQAKRILMLILELLGQLFLKKIIKKVI